MAVKKPKSTFQILRAKVMKERRVKLQLKTFRPEETSIRGRVAEFLNWCADRYPHQIITHEEVTQAIFTLGKVPDGRAKHVKSVKGQMSSAAKLLMEKYKKSLITMRGVGVRASVDDADILKESVTKEVERHKQTADKLQKTADLINPGALQDQLDALKGDPELKEELLTLSEWFNGTMGKYLKSLKRPTVAAALLPPPPEA
jgi:hypothetical protein